MAQRSVSLFQAAVGMTLFATIALPLTAGGPSLLDVVLRVFADNPFGALVLLVMFGCPQLFGLSVAVAGLMRDAESVVRTPLTVFVSIMQGMVVLMGVNLVGAKLVATVALLGFALVTGLYFPAAAGQAAASTRGQLSLRWYVRWGALLIAGFGGWTRLQMIGAAAPAIDVAIVSAVLLLASTARPEPAQAPEG